MSTDDPKEQGAPERNIPAKDDEDDTEGHRLLPKSADPDFDSRAPSRGDDDDVEGHRLLP